MEAISAAFTSDVRGFLASTETRSRIACRVHRIPRFCAVAAALMGWLVASGLAWDGLQLAAWANMAWKNASRMDGVAALRVAVTGAPCGHCLSIREARHQSESQGPVAESTKRPITELPPPSTPFPAPLLPREAFERPTDRVAASRPGEVAVPPPRRAG